MRSRPVRVTDIQFRPGKYNDGPDTFTRAECAIISSNSLHDIHTALCHPRVTRLNHFIKTKNLPYSLDNIKQVYKECKICQEVKPRYYNPNKVKLVKAMQPLQRLSIDFKRPLPSKVHPFLLTIIDEYSRFPFTYPVKDFSTPTVIKCLGNLFSIFGMPGYVRSDCGPSFMSEELKRWLFEKGIPSSRTTPYNPQGNGQVERYNGIIWKSVLHPVKPRDLPITEWERVLLTPFTQLFHYSVLLLMLLRMNVFLTFRDDQQTVPLCQRFLMVNATRNCLDEKKCKTQ